MNQTIFVLGLILLCSTSTLAKKKHNKVEDTQEISVSKAEIERLKTDKLGQILIGMAELHTLAGGPLDDLTNAINQLINDLATRTGELDEDYNQRTLFHQSQITRLNDLISSAQVDVSNLSQELENTLYPNVELLQHKIQTLGKNIDENNALVEQLTTNRANDNQSYQDRVSEKNDALKAVDECLDIIREVSGGNIALAETQTSTRIQESIEKVVISMNQKQNQDAELVKVLAELAEKQFADMSSLLAVSQALGNIQNSIVENLQQEHADQARSLDDFLKEQKEQNDETRDFTQNIILNTSELKNVQDQIAQAENLLELRNQDLVTATSENDYENTSFENATSAYNEVIGQIQKEVATANDTIEIIQNAGFADYLNKRT